MGKSENKLAIAIPTYNRAFILDENLRYIIKEIKKYKIPIYISDDSNNDDTEKIINIIKSEYPFIYYFKNDKSLGHDKNCLYTMSLPKEDYIWYLGDSMMIVEGALTKIMEIIDNRKYDFLTLNAVGRSLSVKSKEYHNPHTIMDEIGWHLTLTGSTIYKKSSLNLNNLNLEKCENFPQLALVLKDFRNKELFWLNDKLIVSNAKKKSYWQNNILKVFIDDYHKTLEYVFGNKPQNLEWVFQHMDKSQLFSYFQLLKLRTVGSLDKNNRLKYRNVLGKLTFSKRLFIFFIFMIPDFFLKRLENCILMSKNKMKFLKRKP
ncbi:MAG: glycosyl transferase family 2 [Chryseobacterium sp.]|jgi:hypothetical protein|uniref:glycosyltransferase n=1 Tax=Chryseobacterium sp. TaxID=1871047 RepID=UPI0026387037|nr:glycosyltransferase [Chryseobacterium sp.]MDF2553888.1 glycosyl transferase family 2 [Chryseobacterium sp.]